MYSRQRFWDSNTIVKIFKLLYISGDMREANLDMVQN